MRKPYTYYLPCNPIVCCLSLWVFLICFWAACTNSTKKLPILGPKELSESKETDTVYHTIQAFEFINQDGQLVNEQTFAGKIYVCDFIFTSCPSICPLMSQQMQRIQEVFQKEEDILFLSHTVDPERDSVETLKQYAQAYQAQSGKWHLVTGDKKSLYEMGIRHYLVSVDEDEASEEQFLHSAAFVLIDKDKRIRGMYNGTEKEDVDRLIGDIRILQREYAP